MSETGPVWSSGPVVQGDDVPIYHQGGVPGADRSGDGDEDADCTGACLGG